MIVKIKCVYGRTFYVDSEDLDDSVRPRTQIPLRFKTGLKYRDHPIKRHDWTTWTIHRDNIAMVGDKQIRPILDSKDI